MPVNVFEVIGLVVLEIVLIYGIYKLMFIIPFFL